MFLLLMCSFIYTQATNVLSQMSYRTGSFGPSRFNPHIECNKKAQVTPKFANPCSTETNNVALANLVYPNNDNIGASSKCSVTTLEDRADAPNVVSNKRSSRSDAFACASSADNKRTHLGPLNTTSWLIQTEDMGMPL